MSPSGYSEENDSQEYRDDDRKYDLCQRVVTCPVRLNGLRAVHQDGRRCRVGGEICSPATSRTRKNEYASPLLRKARPQNGENRV